MEFIMWFLVSGLFIIGILCLARFEHTNNKKMLVDGAIGISLALILLNNILTNF